MSDLGPMTLSVHPTVVFKLGEDLITDDLQALTELIKNSYDAGSSGAEVTIDTRVWTDLAGAEVDTATAEEVESQKTALSDSFLRLLSDGAHAFREALEDRNENSVPVLLATVEELARRQPALAADDAGAELMGIATRLRALPVYLRGRIVVTDAGQGMSREDIERGWLTVSASPKRELKRQLRGSRHGEGEAIRTPLGDKGLGRLGVQRLGRVVDLVTRREGHAALACTIDWARFQFANALRDIPIEVTRADDSARPGTSIIIRGLSSVDVWSDVARLQADLAELISPYSPTRGFRVRVRVDGAPIDLQEVSRHVLDSSAVRYLLDYRDGTLTIQGLVRAEFLRADRGEDKQAIWERLIRRDNGYDFLTDALESSPRLRALGVEPGDDDRFAQIRTRVRLSDLEAKYEIDARGTRVLADPGPFTARVDVIQRRAASAVFTSRTDYEDWLDRSSGVRIYRDGFGVRTKSDWLQFDRWMTGSSYYAIRPSNVIGYVDISARDNAQLEETTSREEFRDTAPYQNFLLLLGQWLSITEDFQTLLGRAYVNYAKKKTPTPTGITPASTSTEIAADIKKALGQVTRAARSVDQGAKTRQRATRAATALVQEAEALEREVFSDPALVARVRRLAENVTAAIEELNAAVEPVHQASAEAVERSNSVDLLLGRLEEAQDQIADGWELMSLGITAETVSHEILNLTGRLIAASRQIVKYNDAALRDPRIGTYVEHVRSTTQSLQKQASRMDASLRYVRERRTVVDIVELARQLTSHFEDAESSAGITFEVIERSRLKVKTSEGKLSQAIDNLLLNAVYWVGVAQQQDPKHDARITLTVDAPYLTIEDSGPGVEQSIEPVLWDPFTTRKPRGVGRGLGLFVTKQLLETEGIEPSLDEERNTRGNRFRFRIDFTRPLEGE